MAKIWKIEMDCEQGWITARHFISYLSCRSRESANLEYLKNIVLRFMMSTSYSVKQQMITAIATILEFSPKEVSSFVHHARYREIDEFTKHAEVFLRLILVLEMSLTYCEVPVWSPLKTNTVYSFCFEKG